MFSISVIAIVFGLIFVAELPDKTAVAGLVLGTRFPVRWVFAGMAAAFLTHVVIAVAAGSLLSLLPRRPVEVVVAVLFLVGAVLVWREGLETEEDEEEEVSQVPEAAGFWRVASLGYGVIFIAEWGEPHPDPHGQPRREVPRPHLRGHRSDVGTVGRRSARDPRRQESPRGPAVEVDHPGRRSGDGRARDLQPHGRDPRLTACMVRPGGSGPGRRTAVRLLLTPQTPGACTVAGMDLPDMMCRHAERFTALGQKHGVASPLGAWLVLALAAPAATRDLADEISHALGADLDTAHSAATELLAHPHPSVSAAAAAWRRDGLPGLDPWLATLPAEVETGGIPTQDHADAWAREHTLGLIERLPMDTSNLAVALASALATRVTWATPFETTDAADLRGCWSTTLTRVLRASDLLGHEAFITETERAGLVAVHSASADDLEVTSVIADPAVAPSDVLAAAHEIAVWQAGHGSGPRALSLFEVPLGDGAQWTITETQAAERGERIDALLPAWRATSEHDLMAQPALGLVAAGHALQELAGLTEPAGAAQSAVARYDRRGFEAAAVTVLGVPMSGRVAEPPGAYRTATLRFGHPYAVVATAQGSAPDDLWDGLPVFAAWITEPEDSQG